jgi:hypothetical protein
MKNIKNRITILKKHKSKATNKDSNNDSNLSNDSNNNNSINSNINENECLICLEVKNNNNEKTIKLNDLACCEKYCECDGWIHKTCLDSWFIIKFTCPICRNSISSFIPQHQIHYYEQRQTQRQRQIHIIHTSLTNNDYFIIFMSAIFIYCFYFS